MSILLERGEELAAVRALLERGRDAQAGALLVEGPAGIGKTALLDATRELAREAGFRVLAARGGELEREFAHAVVRQLFEPALTPEVLTGAAELAAPVLTPGTAARAPVGDQAFAVAHGLYWLTANLARRAPLALVVDDVHWCDRPSLAFLLYLLRRLEGLPVALVLGARVREPGAADLLEQIAAEPATRVLAPATLSVTAVGELVAATLGPPDERFVLACHDATGGNPFLASELLSALAREGVRPDAAASARVGELGPTTVRRAIMLRLGRLPEPAGALAQATAVLGGRARLRNAAALAGVEDGTATAAVDALTATEILKPRLPLEFVHPIVQAAVYEDMTPAARAAAHGRAARLLAADRADPEQVAAHLLASEPAGDAWVTSQLRGAAVTAVAGGAADAARVYLERAAAETPGSADVLFELGRTEALMRDPRALAHLREALALSEDPRARARVAEELTMLLLFAGQWDATGELLEQTLRELGDEDDAAATRLATLRAVTAAYDPQLVGEFDRARERLEALAARGGPAARPLQLVLGAIVMGRAESVGRARSLIERGLDDGGLLADEGAEAWAFGQAATGLIGIDDLDAADRLAAAMVADATRRGSVLGASAGSSFAGFAQAQRGALGEAEASLQIGFRLAIEHGLAFALPSILRYSIDAIAERPGLAEVEQAIETLTLPPPFDRTASAAMLLEARGHLYLRRDERAAGIADLRRCGEINSAVRLTNPIMSSWRSALALALRAAEPDEARALVADELEIARALGLPRAEGVALRAAGLLAGGGDGVELLRASVGALRRAPAAYEQARALTELGAALRRAGHRADAREPLREALELARGCGAERLSARAEEELRAAGAKPRRRAFSGVESLTASERRIAELVAGGMTNQQVAEALFVTAKTVENHLGRVYHKLAIHARGELAGALR
jgi:DNA-binding CsgD family transcriptional regulator